ncbi:hypothetical protein VLK31_25645 [Variovorax sp. H27-G14]|uniref:hypothetical protein n=1 Tax=Variovorax sp. H27-G14 TaxID=3111914 RepID=UPI0038FC5E36
MAECDVAGASVAKMGMSHGINTNAVHGWRKSAREAGAGVVTINDESPSSFLSGAQPLYEQHSDRQPPQLQNTTRD